MAIGSGRGPLILLQAFLNAMISPKQERDEELEKDLQGFGVALLLAMLILCCLVAAVELMGLLGVDIRPAGTAEGTWIIAIVVIAGFSYLLRWSENHFESNKRIVKEIAASIRKKVPHGYLGLHFIVWSVFIVVAWTTVFAQLGYLPNLFGS